MTDAFAGGGGGTKAATGVPSALRLLGLMMGLISFARSVSVDPSALNLTVYMGEAEEPVIDVMRAG